MSIYLTKISRRAACLLLLAGMALPLAAADKSKGFSIEKTDGLVTIKHDGKLFTKYVFKGDSNKPYFWPVMGPTGQPMTRAYPMDDIKTEQQDHPHHRGIWFGHEGVSGADTWHEPKSVEGTKSESMKARGLRMGSTKHREFKETGVYPDKAIIVSVNDYFDVKGKKLMEDERRYTFRVEKGNHIIDCDIEFKASAGDVTLEDAKDAGFSVRVPTVMSVDKKMGGKILTSEGKVDKDAWGTRATWCSYYGPLEGEMVGITMLNHPSSFRHPTPWHVRTYGLLTANPFGTKNLDKDAPDGTITLKSGEKLVLRHRIILHKGEPKAAGIEAAYAEYAKEKK
ncbi:MAG TPA: PmoA family protein [Verrucomicrobiae bacterium]